MNPSLVALTLVTLVLAVWLWKKETARRDLLRQLTDLRRQATPPPQPLLPPEPPSYRILFDNLRDALLTLDHEGHILRANKQARQLLGQRELHHRPLEEAIPERHFLEPLKEAIAAQSSLTRRITLSKDSLPARQQNHQSTSYWRLEVHATSDPSTPEQAPFYLAVIRDITESVQTDLIRKDFVANASHELRTPLSIIQGYLENLLEDDLLEDPHVARNLLSAVHRHAQRLQRLVEDMLTISRMESGEGAILRIEPFSLESCLESVLERLRPLIQKQQVKIKVHFPEGPLLLHGDSFYWEQIFFNLIENSLKENANRALKIKIKAQVHPSGALQISVRDDGVGIPTADLPYIFKRFFRVHKPHDPKSVPGTGLGLSIVRNAVEAHQGIIQASSSPGIHTTFTIQMPPQTFELPPLPSGAPPSA